MISSVSVRLRCLLVSRPVHERWWWEQQQGKQLERRAASHPEVCCAWRQDDGMSSAAFLAAAPLNMQRWKSLQGPAKRPYAGRRAPE